MKNNIGRVLLLSEQVTLEAVRIKQLLLMYEGRVRSRLVNRKDIVIFGRVEKIIWDHKLKKVIMITNIKLRRRAGFLTIDFYPREIAEQRVYGLNPESEPDEDHCRALTDLPDLEL